MGFDSVYCDEPTGRDKDTAERVKATLVAPCDYARWVRRDAWALQEAACIIGGIDPEQALGTMKCFLNTPRPMDTPGRQEVYRYCEQFRLSLKPILEEMRGSYLAGKLEILGPWLEDLSLVDPSEIIRWAASKGYSIPDELNGFENPGEWAAKERQTGRSPFEIIEGIHKRWPHLNKYEVGAYAKGLDPEDPDTRKQSENYYSVQFKRKGGSW
jgi:hypothetical protein